MLLYDIICISCYYHCKSELIFLTMMSVSGSVVPVTRRSMLMTTNYFSRTWRSVYNHTVRRSYALGFRLRSGHSGWRAVQFRAVNVKLVRLGFRAYSSTSVAPFRTHLSALRSVALLVHFTTVPLFDIFSIAVRTSIEIPTPSLFLTDLNRNRFMFAYNLRADMAHFVARISAYRWALFEIAIVVNWLHVGFFVTLLKPIATLGRLGVAWVSWFPSQGSPSNKCQCEDGNCEFHFDCSICARIREYSRHSRFGWYNLNICMGWWYLYRKILSSRIINIVLVSNNDVKLQINKKSRSKRAITDNKINRFKLRIVNGSGRACRIELTFNYIALRSHYGSALWKSDRHNEMTYFNIYCKDLSSARIVQLFALIKILYFMVMPSRECKYWIKLMYTRLLISYLLNISPCQANQFDHLIVASF